MIQEFLTISLDLTFCTASSTSTATSTRHQLIKTCSCATTVLVLKYQVVG